MPRNGGSLLFFESGCMTDAAREIDNGHSKTVIWNGHKLGETHACSYSIFI